MSFILYFLICLVAATLGAISGIGGGIIIKPIMDAISGMSISTINFLSSCMVLGMSVVSVCRNLCDNTKIDLKQGTLLAVGGATGGVVGKWLFDIVKSSFGNDCLVGTAQNLLMIILTLVVLMYALNKEKIHMLYVANPGACLLIGLGLGLISSFLGIGGGPINLMVLYYFFSMSTKTAALNSLYIILFSQSASLLTTYIQGKIPFFDPVIMAVMTAGGILGGFIGTVFNKKMSSHQVDILFRCIVILVIAISCYNLFSNAVLL